MTGLARYLSGYVLDNFRARVTAADFAGEEVRQVLLAPGFEEEGKAALARLFPGADFQEIDPRTNLRTRYDAVCLPMSGGNTRLRLRALFARARHRLLAPAPDYCYRLGLGRGPGALAWAVVDRFLLAPIALLWFACIVTWMYGTGLIVRSAGIKR
jgi:hypothetical protein